MGSEAIGLCSAMIAERQNIACRIVADQAAQNPSWTDYAAYCSLREKGLRKEAILKLNAFLASVASWSFDERKTFVLWLCGLMDSVPDADYGPYPQPLKECVFRPFFHDWLALESTNDQALVLKARYLGDFSSYSEAVRINPNNQRARKALAGEAIDAVCFATHHLPEYFIGESGEAEKHVQELASISATLPKRRQQKPCLRNLPTMSSC